MATEIELALFEQELLDVGSLEEASRWQLERDNSVPLGLLAVMHPFSHPDHLYKARLRWQDFFGPFSLKFIDMETNTETNPKAWPRCSGFRPGSLDACIPITSEGQALHPEWARSSATRFPNVEVPIQFALRQLQAILDNSYEGRGA